MCQFCYYIFQSLQSIAQNQFIHVVSTRFSLKESVYKAMHPLLCQFVGFQEAEITPHANGTALVSLNLKNGAHKLLLTEDITAHWRRIDGGFFLTSASVSLKDRGDEDN